MTYRVERMTPSGRIALLAGAVALGAILSMPWWASQGLIRDVITLSCFIAVAQMWNMLAGYGGLVSVGQQAFVGVGAYAMFVMAQLWGLNPFVAVGLSLLAPALLAVPIYLLLHRLEGPYFAIGTWVVAEALRLIATNTPMLNGGAGMSLRVMTQFSAHERAIAGAFLAALLLLVTVGGSYLLLRSRYGIALTAMRDNPVAARSQGVDVQRLRFLIFVAAAVGTGFAGAVYFMVQLRITPPSAFDMNWANLAIFIVMVGGIGSIEGVLIGAVIYFFADRWFGGFGASYLIVLGLLTLMTALFFREGLWGLWRRTFDAPWFPTRRTLIHTGRDTS
ncbi:amino acid/amide ABC transporter membrane protein 2, HAAT family [Pseudosulfitobacter pseudonitzschiae]|uniref:ABC transporter permease n=1 Tax=Pseudosulfitobacter pseudonitzschiae TaxID=1402135 RepID=A0A073J011_9RHOB|nr:branched-chain amino acid ABC transporter permease [Pseudosulfitobacter pseudonitzschiae]KEJ95205.1 ABC transporter permease [Pseudosulfitobacter pseudonitzschiae]QKS11455.1 branched-chain amino acid ABC transporter permease [Pseudosulfitobacter pseudonitzschiae]SHF87993.1 amino acid/amide ABC transporter membrane protein 2, HAAT family [Pseudosulfitobacter pseudonitzschiae]